MYLRAKKQPYRICHRYLQLPFILRYAEFSILIFELDAFFLL